MNTINFKRPESLKGIVKTASLINYESQFNDDKRFWGDYYLWVHENGDMWIDGWHNKTDRFAGGAILEVNWDNISKHELDAIFSDLEDRLEPLPPIATDKERKIIELIQNVLMGWFGEPPHYPYDGAAESFMTDQDENEIDAFEIAILKEIRERGL